MSACRASISRSTQAICFIKIYETEGIILAVRIAGTKTFNGIENINHKRYTVGDGDIKILGYTLTFLAILL